MSLTVSLFNDMQGGQLYIDTWDAQEGDVEDFITIEA